MGPPGRGGGRVGGARRGALCEERDGVRTAAPYLDGSAVRAACARGKAGAPPPARAEPSNGAWAACELPVSHARHASSGRSSRASTHGSKGCSSMQPADTHTFSRMNLRAQQRGDAGAATVGHDIDAAHGGAAGKCGHGLRAGPGWRRPSRQGRAAGPHPRQPARPAHCSAKPARLAVPRSMPGTLCRPGCTASHSSLGGPAGGSRG